MTTLESRAAAMLADMPPRVELVRADSIMPEAVKWVWPGWLAEGKLHILGGPPGTGKTTIAGSIASILSSGARWPDCSRADTGSVVIWSGEDDPADTLVPRLIAAGADMAKIHLVRGVLDGEERRAFDPAHDVEALQVALAALDDVRLLVIDPIVSAISGDSHKNAEVRRGLQPLVDMAQAHGFALLGVTHFTKGTAGRDPVERITGSLAFGALARLVMVAAKQDATDSSPSRRFLARAKSNIGPDGGGFNYELRQIELQDHPGVEASYVHWGDALEGTARELLADAESNDDDTAGSAGDFLANLLCSGPRSANEIYRDAEGAGFSRDQMKRAKRRIKAESLKSGMDGGWVWRLPKGAEGSEPYFPLSSLPSTTSAPLEGGEGSKGARSG